MELLLFLFNSVLLGVGLAMDAFSVSLANGLHDPAMKRRRKLTIAGTFAAFQFLMPMIGWVLVHTLVQYFTYFQRYIPFIALILLLYIGGKMILDALREKDEPEIKETVLSYSMLLVQGIATSIDALSVGFTIADYSALSAFAASLIIAVVTFAICIAGLRLGIRVGMSLSKKASILGGVILIAIGVEIFLKSLLG